MPGSHGRIKSRDDKVIVEGKDAEAPDKEDPSYTELG
jgi:hypothetical protein